MPKSGEGPRRANEEKCGGPGGADELRWGGGWTG